jgi:hypothetical protein
MLWTAAGVLLVPWAHGLHYPHALGGVLLFLLVAAVVVVALRVIPGREVF